MSGDQKKPAFAAVAGSIRFGDQLAQQLAAEPGARLMAKDFGTPIGDLLDLQGFIGQPNTAEMRLEISDIAAEWMAAARQAVDLQLSRMGERAMIKGGAVTGTGVFKAAAVVRDSSARPRHRRQHSAVVHFTDGEPEVYHVKGVAWRKAKRAIAQHVRRQRDVVRFSFVMQPVQPVERITFKSTVGEVLP